MEGLDFAKRGDVVRLEQALEDDREGTIRWRHRNGDTLGHIASRKGHLQFLKRLVSNGWDVASKNHQGRQAVHEAAQNGQIHVLKYLASIKADFSSLTDKGDNVLDLAKNPGTSGFLESILESNEGETASLWEANDTETSNLDPKPSTTSNASLLTGRPRKGKHRDRFSNLAEKAETERIVPSREPIQRITSFRSYGEDRIPICDLSEVGWKDENDDLGFPKRPDWHSLGLNSAAALHEHEERSFSKWIQKVDHIAASESISVFERNIDFWRELWRVIERGHACVWIADARHPLLHLNRAFLHHLQNEKALPVTICLNKADLVKPEVLQDWKRYLEEQLSVNVITHSYKEEESRKKLLETLLEVSVARKISKEEDSETKVQSIREWIEMDVDSVLAFRDVQNKTRKRTSKKAKQRLRPSKPKHRSQSSDSEENDTSSCDSEEETPQNESNLSDPIVLSIVGEPNVGKSSIMNALLGTKKVSVSAHPGRTKHLQTHFLCPQWVLCDSPGIVFPKRNVPFPIQVLFGCYPIARCRDAYSVVEYLAAHIDPSLPSLLGLDVSETSQINVLWICEAFADRRKWTTHRGGRPDIYRAANWILRNALSGNHQLILQFSPPF